jgi:predicted NUDIX family phosphoesterase
VSDGLAPAELVYVVPRERALDGPGWHGIRTDGIEPIFDAIRTGGRFEPRAEMEADPTYKQIIPYLILRDGPRWFLMHRTRAGGDSRLHDHWSLGVGGHLNPGDRDIAGGLAREWREELIAAFEPSYRLVGLLNDDETDVGRVHLGVVFVADAGGRAVAIRETDKLAGRFATTDQVRAVAARLETWSRLVFDALVAAESAG